MAKWSNIIGTTLGYIRLGLSGVRLKNVSGSLSVRNAADSADALVLPQSLGSGTRDGTKFLRDDGTWQSGATEIAVLETTANVTNSTVTPSVISELTYTVPDESAEYMVTVYIPFFSAATTTGLRLDYSATQINFSVFEITVPIVNVASASALMRRFFTKNSPSSITTQTGSVIGTGVTAANSTHIAVIRGRFYSLTGANSVLTVSFASEVAGSLVTVSAGATAVIEKINT